MVRTGRMLEGLGLATLAWLGLALVEIGLRGPAIDRPLVLGYLPGAALLLSGAFGAGVVLVHGAHRALAQRWPERASIATGALLALAGGAVRVCAVGRAGRGRVDRQAGLGRCAARRARGLARAGVARRVGVLRRVARAAHVALARAVVVGRDPRACCVLRSCCKGRCSRIRRSLGTRCFRRG